MANFWIPEKVDLTMDILDYKKLTKEEQTAYDGILSFLVFLDSIQVSNLPNIIDYVTA
jgi:ribonucleoside-diphosphate reductase beta chain